jgi:hypothetical protein
MSDAAVIAVQASQIARLREALRQLLPVVKFYDPQHPAVAFGEKLLKERIAG